MPIITLTTDFGTRDGYVGAMKGVHRAARAASRRSSISRTTSRAATSRTRRGSSRPRAASSRTARSTSSSSIRASAARGAAWSSRAAASATSGPTTACSRTSRARRRVGDRERRAAGADVSPTFHGRDVFAPSPRALARGSSRPRLGPTRRADRHAAVGRRGRAGEGRVVHVDHFGNLITDLPRARGRRRGRRSRARTLPIVRDVRGRRAGRAARVRRLGAARSRSRCAMAAPIARSTRRAARRRAGGASGRRTDDRSSDDRSSSTITALAAGGDGVARDDTGRVTFVPRTAPGDRVRVAARQADEVVRARRARRGARAVAGSRRAAVPALRRGLRRLPVAARRAAGAARGEAGDRRGRAAQARGLVVDPIADPRRRYGWRRRARFHVAGGARRPLRGRQPRRSCRSRTARSSSPSSTPRSRGDRRADAARRRARAAARPPRRHRVGSNAVARAAALVGQRGIAACSRRRAHGAPVIELEPGLSAARGTSRRRAPPATPR